MKTCVFVGPSAGDVALPPGVDRYAPAALGVLWRAVGEGYRRIALVDGLFGGVPAVWHKEILFALTHGVQVLGAASMGALRAAELAPYGMVGVGVIYRYFRGGHLTDDDEVCLLHAPGERGFEPLTLSMVSIRRALRVMVRAGDIDAAAGASTCRALKRWHFTRRDLGTVREALGRAAVDPDRASAAFERCYLDLKVEDYRALVETLDEPRAAVRPLEWPDLETHKWRRQFVDQVGDIPPLEAW